MSPMSPRQRAALIACALFITAVFTWIFSQYPPVTPP